MTIAEFTNALWNRRHLFILVLVVCVTVVVVTTLALPKTYSATATLYVGSTQQTLGADEAEQLTRTYSALAANPNVAQGVAVKLPGDFTPTKLLERMSFAPVERTQLLQITADGPTAAEAQLIANTYASVFVSRIATRFEQGNVPAQIFPAETAPLPTGPSRPNLPLFLGLGGLLSLLLALGVVVVSERVDPRVAPRAEDESVIGEPILARIQGPTLWRPDARAGFVEGFRLLHARLGFLEENTARVLLVTGPSEREHLSLVAANLALACAANGENVLLMEANLRRPTLQTAMRSRSLSRSPIGLSSYLAGAATEADITTESRKHKGLRIVWSGPVPPNSTTHLLGSGRLALLLASFRAEYDRVILDGPPVSEGVDALLLATRVDGVLFVVEHRKTKKLLAQVALNELRRAHARLLGAVLLGAQLPGFSAPEVGEPEKGAPRPRATEADQSEVHV